MRQRRLFAAHYRGGASIRGVSVGALSRRLSYSSLLFGGTAISPVVSVEETVLVMAE